MASSRVATTAELKEVKLVSTMVELLVENLVEQ
jgi:hypothetical protein